MSSDWCRGLKEIFEEAKLRQSKIKNIDTSFFYRSLYLNYQRNINPCSNTSIKKGQVSLFFSFVSKIFSHCEKLNYFRFA